MEDLQAMVCKEPPGPHAYGVGATGPSSCQGNCQEARGDWGGWAEHARSRRENTCRTRKVISWLSKAAGEAAEALSCGRARDSHGACSGGDARACPQGWAQLCQSNRE